ncbi:hypothetical protein MGG_16667 [Pyricularia oryzae 70-15]|uniref:Uncharacterized protein n=3 Tax=Pyricularia oryzae TaxID=318829 RepID=G4N2M6_PYRO7|nr:uncharacterized protein MGG_16667 [Pyricularia oryzae 70-15]EHA51735.1 hypothetical protein MGG_16667 [Pyricularia oryzae 70-15]ELQ35269.1 hypothetical protein OOU_Y34scaffold00719g33 [Pyricularia oryzae Y34]
MHPSITSPITLAQQQQQKQQQQQQQHSVSAITVGMSTTFWSAVGSAARFGMAVAVVATTVASFSSRVMGDDEDPLSLAIWTEEEGDAWWMIP